MLQKQFKIRGLRALLTGRPGIAVHALSGVDLAILPGEVLGLLGPNGSGKTTLVRILAGLVRPDVGTVEINGAPLDGCGHAGLVSPNERSFFWRLSGYENLRFFAALQAVPPAEVDPRCRALLAQFGLSDHAERRYGHYSSGQKKRLALARALLGDPPLLLLDEATDSLDAEAREDLIRWIRDSLHDTGRGVLWATHRIEEIDQICDRVAVLVQGRVGFIGSVADLHQLIAGRPLKQVFIELRSAA